MQEYFQMINIYVLLSICLSVILGKEEHSYYKMQ